MSLENPLWGAPRIHGELLKLGFAVAPSTVGKCMARKRKDDPSAQSWATFLRNHTPQIAGDLRDLSLCKPRFLAWEQAWDKRFLDF
jgi:hypothetical protein